MTSLRRCLRAAIVCALVVGLGTVAFAQDPAAKKAPAPRPQYEPEKVDPSLPRVLLIGDSVSKGYMVPVRDELAGKANVFHIPANGGPTSRGIANIEKWLGKGQWDVIVFNWGLHDIKVTEGKHQVPIDQYEKNLRQLVERLKQTKAKLIWCSTTPVPHNVHIATRTDEDAIAYNAVAKKVMDENGIAIDDLYAFALPQLATTQRSRNIHFSVAGYQVLAKEIAAHISKALEQPPPAAK